jgi:hypothetical protein
MTKASVPDAWGGAASDARRLRVSRRYSAPASAVNAYPYFLAVLVRLS